MKDTSATSIVALGGLGEVGKNMYVITHEDEILIIDAGVMFPEVGLLGVDYVIQDITYLKQNENKIKGLIITHGHEDHIGGIPFLLNQVKIPVIYAPKIAKDLIIKKLEDRDMSYDNIEVVDNDSHIKTKYFNVEFVNTTHSIPDSYAVVVHTPNGTIFETGDFKFDLTPIGPMADIHKMARLGEEGITLLLSDSTNALVPGFSNSESVVDDTLNDIIGRHVGRVIIATFASNIYRVKHIVETCKKYNRRLIVFGRSMEASIELALNNGLIQDKSIFVDANEAQNLNRNELCILCTGSQGEPLAALSRIADGEHKSIKLRPDDIVIFSSSPIPGNNMGVNRTIDKLYLRGVKVFTNGDINDIHASGHANMEELKLMVRLIKPKYMLPFHGEYRMLKNHADLSIMCGVPKDNTFILENGDSLLLNKHVITKGPSIKQDDVYVDGNHANEVATQVIRDRRIMAADGILVIIANIDMKNRKLLIKPAITTRGFIQVNKNEELLKMIEVKSSLSIIEKLKENNVNFTDIKTFLSFQISNYINELTGRHPIILPIILDIKRSN